MIALKAKAWINLSAMRARGEAVDTRNISKPKNDILKLATITDPVPLPEFHADIRRDMREFMAKVQNMPAESRISGFAEAEYSMRNEVISAVFGLR